MTDLTLADTKAELTEALEAKGYTVHQGIPHALDHGRTHAMLTPADPYVSLTAAAFGSRTLHLEVWLGFATTDNDAFSAESDPEIVQLLNALPERWLFVTAAAPFSATDLGGLIVCRIRIDTLILT